MSSTVYIGTFIKEINCVGSFHVSEDTQHDLLYWPLILELFLYKRGSVFPRRGLFFLLCGK